jgi:glutathione peroxidase
LTEANYRELCQLYEKYSSKGLEVLAFPCNNFGSQEPGTNAEIKAFAVNKGATFPILGKLDCENGEKTHPVYQFLRASLSGGILGQSLKWNFTKFLCDPEGVPTKRYGPTQSPMTMENDIIKLLEGSH